MKTKSLILWLVLILFSACNEKNSVKAQTRQNGDSLSSENKEMLNFQAIEVPDLDNSKGFISDGNFKGMNDIIPSSFAGRIYPLNSLDDYREDLPKLVGLIATKNDDDYSVGIISFLKDSAKLTMAVPKDGVLLERNLEKKDEKKLGWILSFDLEDNQILQYIIEDQARVVLDDKNINLDKLKRIFDKSNWKNHYLITLATSTAITYRSLRKVGKAIKVGDIPLLGSAISANSSIYISESSMQRNFKVGLRLVPVQTILEEAFPKGQTGFTDKVSLKTNGGK